MKYKIIVDKQSRTNPSSEKREYEIDIEELRVKGDVYDSLVITKDEDYVMRRLSLSEYHVLSILSEPIKEPLQNINIELFEGDNYIYLVDMVGNKFYAEYLIKNDFTDTYVIKSELNSAIESTAKSIELSVNQKLESYSTTEQLNSILRLLSNSFTVELNKKVNGEDITGAYLMLLINGDTSESKLSADKIELTANDVLNLLAGNTINLTGKNISISSTNFNVDKYGNVVITNNNENSSSLIVKSPSTVASPHDVSIYSGDIFLNGPNGYISLGADTGYAGGAIFIAPNKNETINKTLIQNGNITCVKLTQTSLKSKKKNIKKLKTNALELVKNADICEYNFKGEKKGTKKHIGLIIGDGYNCPNEVISEDGQGVEQYSLTSLLWKAVQELTAKVEKLEQEARKND